MDFKTYCKDILNEKITKKEYEEVLKSTNIQGGCEFEFYIDEDKIEDLSFRRTIEEEFEDWWIDFDDEIDRYNSDLEDVIDEFKSLDKEIDELNLDINDLNEEILDNQDHLKELESENDPDNEYYIKNTKKEIEEQREKIKEIESEIAELEDKKDELDKKIDIEDYNIYKMVDVDLKNILYDPKYNYYFVDIYDSIYQDFTRIYKYYIDSSSYYNSFPDTFDNPIEKNYFDDDDLFGSDLIDENFIENLEGFEKTGIKWDKGWNLESDGSLTNYDYGIEIISPILPLPQLLDSIEKVFKWISKIGFTDNSCGFHIHLSLKNPGKFDPLKLILMIEEESIYLAFDERRGNRYADSIELLKKEIFDSEDLKKFLKKEKLNKIINSTDKFYGIHVIDVEDSHVEFRYMGAENYHHKFENVKQNILKYAYWLQLANDPKFKYKEYQKKINKEMLKIKKAYLEELLDMMTVFTEEGRFKDHNLFKKINKHLHNMKKSIPYSTSKADIFDENEIRNGLNKIIDKFKK